MIKRFTRYFLKNNKTKQFLRKFERINHHDLMTDHVKIRQNKMKRINVKNLSISRLDNFDISKFEIEYLIIASKLAHATHERSPKTSILSVIIFSLKINKVQTKH